MNDGRLVCYYRTHKLRTTPVVYSMTHRKEFRNRIRNRRNATTTDE